MYNLYPGSLTLLGAAATALISSALLMRYRTWPRVPGPKFAGFSDLYLLRKTLGGRCHSDLAEASEKYGSLVRVGPNHLLTDDPEVLKKISAVRSPYRRSIWYEGLSTDPGYRNVLSETNENRHNELRARMAAGGKENENLEQTIDENIARLIQLLESKYLSTNAKYSPVDFAEKVSLFTLDVISQLTLSTPLGNLEADNDVISYIKAAEESIPAMVTLGASPWLAKLFFCWPLSKLLPSGTDKTGIGIVMGMAKEVTEERFGPGKLAKQDMIGSFIRHGLSPKEIQGELPIQFFAGSDTTATAIRAMLLHVLSNSQIQLKLLGEIRNVSLSSPVTDAEARKLPYLQAVIKEGLRIRPAAAGLFLKDAPAGGDTIKGYFLPEGTQVGWSSLGLVRNVKVWGQDAKLFRPERWFEGSSE